MPNLSKGNAFHSILKIINKICTIYYKLLYKIYFKNYSIKKYKKINYKINIFILYFIKTFIKYIYICIYVGKLRNVLWLIRKCCNVVLLYLQCLQEICGNFMQKEAVDVQK